MLRQSDSFFGTSGGYRRRNCRCGQYHRNSGGDTGCGVYCVSIYVDSLDRAKCLPCQYFSPLGKNAVNPGKWEIWKLQNREAFCTSSPGWFPGLHPWGIYVFFLRLIGLFRYIVFRNAFFRKLVWIWSSCQVVALGCSKGMLEAIQIWMKWEACCVVRSLKQWLDRWWRIPNTPSIPVFNNQMNGFNSSSRAKRCIGKSHK